MKEHSDHLLDVVDRLTKERDNATTALRNMVDAWDVFQGDDPDSYGPMKPLEEACEEARALLSPETGEYACSGANYHLPACGGTCGSVKEGT